MTDLAPLGDTIRVVEWDELPDSVRSIPDNFNPLELGVAMQHQIEWMTFIHDYQLAVCEKCRRSGITLSTSWDDTISAASQKSAGGMNAFYIGDTKEKGLEYIGYVAKFARMIAKAQGMGISGIEEFIFTDQEKRGEDSRDIASFRIRFASGFRIVALSSRPENIHGLQGSVTIDEAALHKDVRKVIESATALLIWGGRLRIISTHRGMKNAFNELIKDINNGLYGDKAGVYKITFDQCVANGLYERVCFMTGETPTEEGKKAWYTSIRKAYGPRKAAMLEELDTIPREGEGAAIPGVFITRAMKGVRTIFRLEFEDSFKDLPLETRTHEIDAWIERDLNPELAKLPPKLQHFFGMDFARKGHLSVIVPIIKQQNLSRFVPFVIELRNCPVSAQQQILWYLIPKLPRFTGGAMDATGPGQNLAELTWEKFKTVEQVVFSQMWYRDNMSAFVQLFEDDMLDIPRDADHESDLRDLDRIDGIIRPPHAATEDENGNDRHADYAIGLALADFAVRVCKPSPMEFESTGQTRKSLQALEDSVNTGRWNQSNNSMPTGNDFTGFTL